MGERKDSASSTTAIFLNSEQKEWNDTCFLLYCGLPAPTPCLLATDDQLEAKGWPLQQVTSQHSLDYVHQDAHSEAAVLPVIDYTVAFTVDPPCWAQLRKPGKSRLCICLLLLLQCIESRGTRNYISQVHSNNVHFSVYSRKCL